MIRDQKHLLVVPSGDFVRSYAGTAYLLDELHEKGVRIRVALRTTSNLAKEYDALPYECTLWVWGSPKWGRIRRLVASVASRSWIVLKMMRTKYLLVTDSVFLAEAAFVKRIRGKGITVIQFCHELQIDDCPTTCRRAGIYARYARVPDFVIDVDPFRAEVRREHFRLVQKPYVLLNTLPRKALPKKEGRGRLSALAGGCDFCGRPVVVFTGGVGKEKPFERVIDAIAQSGTNVFFVAFLTVDAGKISQLTQYAKERLSEGHYRICPAVTRTEILSAIWEADIGVVDYTYSVEPTLNQKYCAPTKLYEYMASGLAVLGSNNDSLRRVIEGEGIGVCAQDDSVQSLAQGLKRLVANPALLCEMKLRAASCFATKYSWEEVCSPVVEQILEEVGVPRSTHTMTNVNT